MRRLLRRTGPQSGPAPDCASAFEAGRRARGLLCAALVAAGSLATPAWADEALREGELPDWMPSIGVGFGLQSRDLNGKIDGPLNPFRALFGETFRGAFLKSDTVSAATSFQCRTGPPSFAGFCFFYDESRKAADGASLPLGMQLIGPAEPLLGRIRPFAQGAFAFDFDSRVISSSGFKPASFRSNPSQPAIRLQLEAQPAYTWWAGGGLAMQVPVDMPLFVKLGWNYSKQRIDLQGNIWREFSIANQPVIRRTKADEEITITGWGPSFGLEAEVWRLGSLAMNISADLLVFLPRSGSDLQFKLDEPRATDDPPACGTPNAPNNCIPPADFFIDADETQYHGSIMLRLTWLGF